MYIKTSLLIYQINDTHSLALDDARIKEMWLNMAWLAPSDGVAPRDALQYEWMAYADAEEVCASYIINVPEVTLCQDTHKYILCAHDLRRLHDYLESIATSIEPTCEPRVAGSKKESKQKPTNAVRRAPQHYPRVGCIHKKKAQGHYLARIRAISDM